MRDVGAIMEKPRQQFTNQGFYEFKYYYVRERPRTSERNYQRASVPGCFSGGNPWVDSLDLHLQSEKEPNFACGAKLPEPADDILPAALNYPHWSERGGYFVYCGESSNLT